MASSIAFFQPAALPRRHRWRLCLALAWLPAAWSSALADTPAGAGSTQAGLAAPKQEAPRVTAPPPEAQPELLLLDVTINQQRLSDVVRAEYWPDGTLLLPADAWAEARLAVPAQIRKLTDGTLAYALGAVPGTTYRLDRQILSLEITALANAFVGATLGFQDARAAPPPRPAPGVLLNYDLSVERNPGGGGLTGGAALEAVAFSPLGDVVTSALIRDDGNQRQAERLDTYWRYDMPQRLETLVLGDNVGVAGGWSRAARYGGIRWGRDFGMNPGVVTMPQLTLAGEAAMPSTVELLVNNARRMSQPLQPGPFELTNIPVVAGAGMLNLVVRDLLGRETVIRRSYYASPRLLAPKLNDFSLEAGWLRTGYGKDNHYNDAFGALTWRRGLNRSLTGEARIELQGVRRAAGIELAGVLGNWALGRMALAGSSGISQGVSEKGHLLQLGVERNTPRGGGTLQYERASQGFAPFGEAPFEEQGVNQRARERWLGALGGTVWRSVVGGLSYASQTRWDGERVKNVDLSLGFAVGRRASLNLSLNKRLDGDGGWRTSLALSLPLDDGLITGSRVELSRGNPMSASVSAARNSVTGPPRGWRVEASNQENQRARGGVQYATSGAELTADAASDANGQVALRGGARGTFGLLAGLPFASRSVGQGSFAVVDTGGLAGVLVKRSHQVVATTNARGLAFVPGLLPWQQNQIEIDPVDMPLDVALGDPVQYVTPYPSSGSVVTFAIRRTRQALLVLQQADGTPVPPGATVRLLAGGADFIVGRRGEAWMTDLAAGRQTLQARWDGGSCQVQLELPADQGTPAKIGPLACKKD